MSFVKVYFDFEERTEMLNEVEQGRLLLTMLRYAQGKTLPELKGNERFLFPVFKADIDRDAAIYGAKVSNGAKGGRPRQEPKETEENLTKPNETEDNLNAKNKNKNKKEEQEQDQDNISFGQFWAIYPNKVKKKDAFTAWRSGKCEKIVDTIIADVQRRIDTEWKGDGAQYVPHPTTYLHQRRWEDETPPQERKQGRSKEWKNPALAYQQREYTDDMFGDDFYYNVIEEYGDKKKDKADDQYDGYIDLDNYGEG